MTSRITDNHPYLRKRPLVLFVYWLAMKVEQFIDYYSDLPLDSAAGRFYTKAWETLLELSLRLYRRGQTRVTGHGSRETRK